MHGPIGSGRPFLPLPRAILAVMAVLVLGACERQPRELGLADLDARERQYVERIVVLERARAVALNNPSLGRALLDSLTEAWGDSSYEATLDLMPTQPVRARKVAGLLERMLEAEADSLLLSPRPERLSAPLPHPPPSRAPEPE